MSEHTAEIDALADLTEKEAEAVDFWMNEHMYAHRISNSYAGMSCDPHCRTQALAEGFRRSVLVPRREAARVTPPEVGAS